MSHIATQMRIVSGLEPKGRDCTKEKITRETIAVRKVADRVLPNSIWARSTNHAQQFAIAFIKKLTANPTLHTRLCNCLNRKESFRNLVNEDKPLSDKEKQNLTLTIKQIHSGLTSKLHFRDKLEGLVQPIANVFFSLPEAKKIAIGLFVSVLRDFVSNTPSLIQLKSILSHSERTLTDILRNNLPAESYRKGKSCSGAREIVERFLNSELTEPLLR